MAALRHTLRPQVLSGCLLGVCCMLFVDIILVMQREPLPQNHFSLVFAVPLLFSLAGFSLVSFVSPTEMVEDATPKAKGILFFGWLASFGGSVGALVICGVTFVGEGTRVSVAPGVLLVLISSLLPVASTLSWLQREAPSDGEMFNF